MSKLNTNKMLGFESKYMSVLFALILAIVVMGVIFFMVGVQTKHDKEYIRLAGEQRVLSQRIAKYALEAAVGNPDAFKQLQQYRDQFQATVDTLKNGKDDLPGTGQEMISEMLKVEKNWIEFRNNLDTILRGKEGVLSVRNNAQRINELMPKLLADSDQIVSILVESGAPAAQIYKASVQLMLNQRIANNVTKVLVGGAGTVTAADRLGRDATIFKGVVQGMSKGDRAQGIVRVKDPDARAILKDVSTNFTIVSDMVGAILDESPSLFEVQEAAGNVIALSDTLIDSSTSLGQGYASAADNRTLSSTLAFMFGGVALLLLFYLGTRLVKDSELRTQQAEEVQMRSQEAILRLLDEIQGLSEGDLTSNAIVTEDMTGAIADAFNSAIDELRQLVTTINETSVQVSSAAQETQATAMHLAEASDHQAQQITAASSAINEMAVSIQEVSRNSEETSKMARQSVDMASKGGDAVRRTIQGMDSIREQIQETSKRIKRLGESSQEIGDIVELITDIADQTNILSLNAAIQAAMAGEAGRGFAVVADEVQRLAERSTDATKQIEALVKTIQTDTNEAVISMEQSTSGVVSGAKLSEDAGEALVEIENVSNRLAEFIHTITESAGQQSNAAANISDTMNVIQEITTQTSAGTNETAASIGNLAELANDLRRSVAGFKLPED
ncbi:MAG TPA: chemotaxis protein [Gammaproteobacteria bacterium]|nr:chemotaxis protein [Gammaproteobacteria bacterium]